VNTKYFFGSDTDVAEGETWQEVPWWIFLRRGQFKYIRTLVNNEFEELYDLAKDPEELNNLALDSAHHAQLAKFRELALSELRRTDAGMVDNLPAVRITTLATVQWMRRLRYVLAGVVVIVAIYLTCRIARRLFKRRPAPA
jgi:hypothetical protein